LAKLAPLPDPTPAEAAQVVPLVQTIDRLPVESTFEPEIVLTLPKASAVVETVQLAVTVAVTLIVELAVPASAPAGAAHSSTAPATRAPELEILMLLVLVACAKPGLQARFAFLFRALVNEPPPVTAAITACGLRCS
jgi:hypothetical protein